MDLFPFENQTVDSGFLPVVYQTTGSIQLYMTISNDFWIKTEPFREKMGSVYPDTRNRPVRVDLKCKVSMPILSGC